jgi:hypothetical protein
MIYINYAGVWCTHQLTNNNSIDIAPRRVKAITWLGTVCSPFRDIMRCADSAAVLIHRVMDCQEIAAVIRLHHSKADSTKDGELCTLRMTKFHSIYYHSISSAHVVQKKESRE